MSAPPSLQSPPPPLTTPIDIRRLRAVPRQILPLVLELHPWVLFMDTDAVFNNPLTTPAVEDVLKLAAISSVSILMPDNDQGWCASMSVPFITLHALNLPLSSLSLFLQ